jgi:hypothetical protein
MKHSGIIGTEQRSRRACGSEDYCLMACGSKDYCLVACGSKEKNFLMAPFPCRNDSKGTILAVKGTRIAIFQKRENCNPPLIAPLTAAARSRAETNTRERGQMQRGRSRKPAFVTGQKSASKEQGLPPLTPPGAARPCDPGLNFGLTRAAFSWKPRPSGSRYANFRKLY